MNMAKNNRTRAARERRQKEQRRSQRSLWIAGIVVIAVVVLAFVVVSMQPTEAYIPEDLSAKYDGLQRSVSTEGYPRLGDPDAPVTVIEYASFSCPGCEAFHASSFDAILDRVQTGQILFTYVPLQTGSIPNAEGSARAALCAGQQGLFWEMHDTLYDWHTRYANTAFSQNRILAGVDGLGMDQDSFLSCFSSQPTSETLDNAQGEGVSITPTISVNGVPVYGEDAASIPTADDVLLAIDSATPSDWQPVTDVEPEPEPEADVEVEADAGVDAEPEATATEVEPEATATTEDASGD
jgi:protein-disulfide isomerase